MKKIKGQASRSISCRCGYFCPGRSRKRSGSAGAWTVPPGGLRFIQLALPGEGNGGGFCDFKNLAAFFGTHALARHIAKKKPGGLFY